MFYQNKIKRVPINIEQLLTPLALSICYMDDGSIKYRQSKGVFLNTQSFSPDDNDMLCDILQKKYQITAWKRPDSESFRIYISGKSYEKLGQLITPYFTEDMWHKWPKPRKIRAKNE